MAPHRPTQDWDPAGEPDGLEGALADLLAEVLAQPPAGGKATGASQGAPPAPGDAGDALPPGESLDATLAALGEPGLDEGAAGPCWSRLLADPDLRAHVEDVGHARLAASRTVLSPALRAAALAAFDQALPGPVPARASGGTVRLQPIRARGWRRGNRPRAWAAAAVLLLGLGATIYLAAAGRRAEAGLQLTALKRVDLAGAVRLSSVEPRYVATVGQVYAPAPDELLSFGLGPASQVVVGGGDAVRVARSPLAARVARVQAGADENAPVLRLETGEARLVTDDGPLVLEVADAGVLVLLEGAAHVAVDAGPGAPAVALADRAVARFYRSRGEPVPLAGPTRVLLAADGPQRFGEPARSLFRDLAFFGGALPPPQQVRLVSARLWEILDGAARRGRAEVCVLGRAGSHDAGGEAVGARVRLAWSAPPVLADARTLRVALRAPVGTRVGVARLGSGVEPLEGRLGASTRSAEPGVGAVDLALPADWWARLEGGRIVLTIEVPAPLPGEDGNGDVRALFDGVSLVLAGTNEEALQRLRERDHDQ